MNIQDLIDKLSNINNLNRKVNFKINIIDEEDENYDIDGRFELFNLDKVDEPLDIMLFRKDSVSEADKNNSIRNLLFDRNYDNFEIEVNSKDGIFIYDKKGSIIREIQFKSNVTKHKIEIVKKLQNML
jgi:hypothetical protein